MTTGAGIGLGSEFHLANASAVLTQIAEIKSITPPNPQQDDVDATHMASPNRRREYVAGLIEDGEGVFEMNLVPGSASELLILAALSDGVTRAYKIVLPKPAGGQRKIEGNCIVKGYERTVPIDDVMTAALTVRFTGASTEADV